MNALRDGPIRSGFICPAHGKWMEIVVLVLHVLYALYPICKALPAQDWITLKHVPNIIRLHCIQTQTYIYSYLILLILCKQTASSIILSFAKITRARHYLATNDSNAFLPQSVPQATAMEIVAGSSICFITVTYFG